MQSGGTLGPYRIIRLIGSGGMGSVWLAEDTRLGRQVALKTLRAADPLDLRSRERLMREARAAGALTHANIAAVHDVLERDEQVVIVFEYVEGETLAARLARGRLPELEALEVGCQIASALVAAHAHGVVHRDLKPANVVIGADGQVKVLDFGIARLLSTGTTRSLGGETASGPGFMGTPAYAAPEQMVSSAVDERADLYALGVMLFEMISGSRPFPGHDAAALASSKLGTDAPSLSQAGGRVNPELVRIVDSLLVRQHDRRPSSAAVVLARLRSIIPSSHDRAGFAAGRRSLLVGAAAILIAVAAGVWWQMTRTPFVSLPPVVAVLPLANVSGDPSRDFIAAGIAESLISSLASLPSVTVLSRASVAEARGRSAEPAALARDLGATFLVEGSVQESGRQLRISINLVRPDRSVAWGDSVDGPFDRIFELQSRLAGALTGALAVRVSPDERQRMNLPPTSSPEALAAYWRGRALVERRDVAGNLDAAIASFTEALGLDGDFALAHAALGAASWEKYNVTRNSEWARQAIEEGTTALRLDPDRPEVRYTLAITLAGSGRPDEAIDELNRALGMQPNYDDARRLLGQVLGRQGRIDESLAEYTKALAVRPNAWSTYSSMGLVLFSAGRYREAIEAFRKVTDLQPDNNIGFQQLGTVYQTIGEMDLALDNYERAIAIRPSPQALSNIGALYHGRGDFGRAVTAYRQALALRPNSSATHRNLGDALAKLGRRDEAREAYREAVRLAEADLQVNPRDPLLLASAAVYLEKAGRSADASVRLAQALALAPADNQVLHRSAVVHALAGRVDEALAALRHAIEHGYSRAAASKDDEFESIRAAPGFAALVAPDGAGGTPP